MKYVPILAILGIVGAGSAFILLELPGDSPSNEELEQIQADGERIIAKLEAYRARAGQYPETLEDAGIEDADTSWGEWDYRRHKEGFDLGVGDYSRHLFAMWWDPDMGGWYVDT